MVGSAIAKESENENLNLSENKNTSFGKSMLTQFRLAAGYMNLNHGSFGSTPKYVYDKQQEYTIMSEAYPDEWFRNEYFSYIDHSRKALADYLHANVDDVVLVENASSAVNSIVRSLKLQKGDIIIYFSTAYGMVKNTCKWLESFEGIRVIEIPVSLPFKNDVEGYVKPFIEALDQLSEEELNRVQLAIFSHIASLPGVILPVEKLIALCHEGYKKGRYIKVLIDGAHALGQIDVNISKLKPDYWLGNGHKWLYSPRAGAVLYVHPNYQEEIEPTVISSSGKDDFLGKFSYTGTRDYTSLCAIRDAFTFRELVGGDQAIKEYIHNLALWASDYLSQLWNTKVLQPPEMTGFMTNIQLPTDDIGVANSVFTSLKQDYDIYFIIASYADAESGKEVVYTRLSLQIYLEKEDIERFGHLVLKLVDTYTKTKTITGADLSSKDGENLRINVYDTDGLQVGNRNY